MDYLSLFVALLVWRYYRLVVHLIAYNFVYRATPVPERPTITEANVHIIIPTVDPENADFLRCVNSCLSQRPAFLTVTTCSAAVTNKAINLLAFHLRSAEIAKYTMISIVTEPMANKRHQMAHVLDAMAGKGMQDPCAIIVLVDDHVWWPSPLFLKTLIAPFEDPQMGIVGTNKRVARERGGTFADSFLNFIACLYLERHNFEITAANAVDGGVFVISGRTCAVRASILLEADFRSGFKHERFFFGLFGPLNPDDDNYITRYIVRRGWKIKIQNCADSLMETTLGTTGGYTKFRGQLLRWARSQWRSNACSVLTDRFVWTRQPWCAVSVFMMSFFNFALIVDVSLFWLWSTSGLPWMSGIALATVIFGSKLVKLYPFFRRNPGDFWLFPAYVAFAYFHSFIKFWSLLTFWDHSWGGRNLDAPELTSQSADSAMVVEKEIDFASKPTKRNRSRSKTPPSDRISRSAIMPRIDSKQELEVHTLENGLLLRRLTLLHDED